MNGWKRERLRMWRRRSSVRCEVHGLSGERAGTAEEGIDMGLAICREGYEGVTEERSV